MAEPPDPPEWGEWWDHYSKDYMLPLSILQLDPADRLVLKIADERDAVQKKTFTKWVNKHLVKAQALIGDLFEGLRDGHNLLTLLEVLSQETLPRERGRMRFHKLQNVQIALGFLKQKGIKLVNIRADEIVDGNPKLILGLIWTIILHFQLSRSNSTESISDVVVQGQEDLSVKEALLLWCRRTVEGYPGVHVKNFTDSWRDGKAFLSIIHRHRPDLVDFRKVRNQSARQNLDMAFNIAEREFGVTQLLDPEDVDVAHPDEKSLITYVSSLYDVFPQVPSVEQSLRDNERQLKWEEYRELSTRLLRWLHDATNSMLDRNFPSTLIEMKSLLAEFNRFRIEDVPPRLIDRQRLGFLYEELQQIHAEGGPFSLEPELHPDVMGRQWDRFTLAQQEKDLAIQAEISRLERLQRLAEKVHRDAKSGEEHLDDIDRRIAENEQRSDKVPLMEAKRSSEEISHALKMVESSIRSMFSDVQALKDGRYHQAEQMHRRIYRLHQRWASLQATLQNEILPRLASRSYTDSTSTVTHRTETVTEYELRAQAGAFSDIQHAMDWVQNKQIELDNTGYGNDLDSTRDALEFHKVIHQEVMDFQADLGRLMSQRESLSGQEASLYREALSRLELAYSQLRHSSTRRGQSLETLLEFMDAATRELVWLSKKEETEVSRDWSSKSLQIREIQEYQERLIQELDQREAQFNAVVDKGEALVMDRHPASKTIEAYMNALQGQWAWLLQLTMCLQNHVEQASQYYKDDSPLIPTHRQLSGVKSPPT